MSASSHNPAEGRLVSLDAYRGFVMLFMASAFGLAVGEISSRSKVATQWDVLHGYLEHAEWVGCTPWDLIQPAFLFIVGAAMPFAYANRQARGQSWRDQFGHAVRRSILLVLLGIFLSSNGSPRANFSFVNVLSQIGLGYTFVFLLLRCRTRVQAIAVLVILVADWSAFALFPTQPVQDYFGSEPLPGHWKFQTGLFEHWEKHANAGGAFDRWFLNLFPRDEHFLRNEGGYTTLNFIPSIATMLIGVMAGEWLRSKERPRRKILVLFLCGAFCLIAGQTMGQTVCPIVKRLWTPSWVLYSAGWTLWLLAGFYGVIDVAGWRRWAFPFVVVGMNSLAMYLMAQLTRRWTRMTLSTHLDTVVEWSSDWFGAHVPRDVFGGPYGPLVASFCVLAAWWFVCYWLYRRRIFFRI